MHILARDARQGGWLSFDKPIRILTARRVDEVRDVIAEADRAAGAGRWVAGMLSYEAAPAFDEAFRTGATADPPLVLFGVYESPEIMTAPPWSHEDSRVPTPVATVSRESFMGGVEAIRSRIREGDTYQTNLTYRLHAQFGGDTKALFQRLCCAQGATYAFYLESEELVICSASPELFFSSEGDTIRSRPMKGTLQRSSPFADLTGSEKESAENLMILDMVRNDLSRICEPGTVRVPDLLTLESYPTVWQLTSTAEGHTNARLPHILDALFPAASITGAPKTSAVSIIRELEHSPRGVYTGALGFVAPDGYTQFNVAIRTAVVDPRRSRLEFGVGGGIVWDSDPQREWEETTLKSRILDFQIPEFDLLETLKWTPEDGFCLEDAHLRRMAASAEYFGYAWRPDTIREELLRAVLGSERPQRVRLLLQRSGVSRAEVTPWTSMSGPVRVALAPGAVSSANPFLYHKTTHRRVYEQALGDCPEADDVLLWNERGELTESCISNIFIERDGELLTPPVYCGLLPGTLRESLLASGSARECVLFRDDLSRGRIKLGNSVRGLYDVDFR